MLRPTKTFYDYLGREGIGYCSLGEALGNKPQLSAWLAKKGIFTDEGRTFLFGLDNPSAVDVGGIGLCSLTKALRCFSSISSAVVHPLEMCRLCLGCGEEDGVEARHLCVSRIVAVDLRQM